MKNKGIRTITAGVLAVSVVISTAVSVVALEPSPDGTSFASIQQVSQDSSENCAKLLDWLGGKPRSITTRWYVTIQLCTHRKLGTPRRVLVLSYWGFILRQ